MEVSSAVRDRLIEAGIREIEANGLQNFSLRHVAQLCGVSCAAPYRHFKDKEEYINEIRLSFGAILDNTVIEYPDGSRKVLKKDKNMI